MLLAQLTSFPAVYSRLHHIDKPAQVGNAQVAVDPGALHIEQDAESAAGQWTGVAKSAGIASSKRKHKRSVVKTLLGAIVRGPVRLLTAGPVGCALIIDRQNGKVDEI